MSGQQELAGLPSLFCCAWDALDPSDYISLNWRCANGHKLQPISCACDCTMPAGSKVSVKWQVVFSIFFPVSIWAFYRICRLKRYVLYVLLPMVFVLAGLSFAAFYEIESMMEAVYEDGRQPLQQSGIPLQPDAEMHPTPIHPVVGKSETPFPALYTASGFGFAAFSAILAARWSSQWNEDRS